MTLLRRILSSLFWLLVVSWSVYLLQRLVRSTARAAAGSHPQRHEPLDLSSAPGRRLARDPVCGVHLPEANAIACRSGQETVYFCSEACRNSYFGTVRKLAANE